MNENEKVDQAAQDQEGHDSMVESNVDRRLAAAKKTHGIWADLPDDFFAEMGMEHDKTQTQTQIMAEIKLGRVALAIERIVKENHISIKEIDMKTERAENLLGDLFRQRDDLIKTIERD